MPASLWVVASCGVLAGAIFAQEAKSAAATPAAIAPSAEPATAPATPEREPVSPPVAGGKAGTPLRLLDSDAPRATAATPSDTPASKPSSPSLILIVLLVAGGAAIYFMKKGSGPRVNAKRSGKQLEILSSVRVAGRWQVALVKVPGKTLVLGATEKGLTLLTTLDVDDDLDDELAFAAGTGISVPPARSAADADLVPSAPPRTQRASSTPHPDAFLGKLLDELNGAPLPVRERPLTPSAEALRQRLERFQRKAG
jgi:flagellar biogenesis protein FliO